MTDRRRIPNPEPILRAMPAGSAVIYRDYDDPHREATARRFQAICAVRGVVFLVAGDAALAERVGADGVHWPARFPSLEKEGRERPAAPSRPASREREGSYCEPLIARETLPFPQGRLRQHDIVRESPRFSREGGLIITAAAHSAADLNRAASLGARLALLSPVFPTESHPGAEHLGAARFKALAAAAPLPVLALGGADETNARRLAGRNVAGIAAIGAFLVRP